MLLWMHHRHPDVYYWHNSRYQTDFGLIIKHQSLTIRIQTPDESVMNIFSDCFLSSFHVSSIEFQHLSSHQFVYLFLFIYFVGLLLFLFSFHVTNDNRYKYVTWLERNNSSRCAHALYSTYRRRCSDHRFLFREINKSVVSKKILSQKCPVLNSFRRDG